MLFKVVLSRIIAQSAEAEIEAEDFAAAKAEAIRRFEVGDADWQDNSVEYGTHEIHGPDRAEEFRFEEK